MNHFLALLILSLAPFAAQADEPTSCPPGQKLILDGDAADASALCFTISPNIGNIKCQKGFTPHWNSKNPDAELTCVADRTPPQSVAQDCSNSAELLRQFQKIQKSAQTTLDSLRKITAEESQDAKVSRWVLDKDGFAGSLIQEAFNKASLCGKLISDSSGQLDLVQAQKNVQCLRRAFRPLAGYNQFKKDIALLLTADEKAKIKNQHQILVSSANLFLNQTHKFATESLVPSGAGNCLASKPESTETSSSVNRKPAVEPAGVAQ